MGDKTGIQWTDATWNPIVGCSLVSPACTNCYAMAMAARIVKMETARGRQTHYAGTTKLVNGKPVWTGSLRQALEHILTAPLRWKRPRRIFVNSMSDLFHESIPDEWIDRVFAVMALAPQHTFQVLTKRPKRMREYFEGNADQTRRSMVNNTCFFLNQWRGLRFTDEQCHIRRWPLPNVWLGVTAEDQPRADERIPDLLATLAAVRFVSIEPMLGAIDLTKVRVSEGTFANALIGEYWTEFGGAVARGHRLNWVICGGESGPNARPMHPDWARSLRDQCAAAGVPFVFKQWGEWAAFYDRDVDDPDWRQPPQTDGQMGRGATRYHNLAGGMGFHGERVIAVRNVGKVRAGRLLDGQEHDEFPEARP